MITDPYGRPVKSLRISVTQRCNLSCFYCHMEGERLQTNPTEMAPQEIERIVEVAASFGVDNVKLTGGEPLLRKDIKEIVKRISGVPGIIEVSMTTNGTLLEGAAGPLKEAGLTRVNVSLDTVKPETYKMITGFDLLDAVVSGIREAVEVGLSPVKVNMVLMKGVNDDQVWEMVDFARRNSLILQLIELESSMENPSEVYMRRHLDLAEIENELNKRAEKVIVREMHHRRKYLLPEGVEVEVVRPMHNTEFCRYCNRLRVTSDGRLKPCLFRDDNLVDILGPIRRGAQEADLRKLFLEAVKRRRPYFT
jgi:cyclic pyranopterin phosphate synthase